MTIPMEKSERVCAGETCTNQISIIAERHNDPYCSTVCAREAYGNPLPVLEHKGPDKKKKRKKVS